MNEIRPTYTTKATIFPDGDELHQAEIILPSVAGWVDLISMTVLKCEDCSVVNCTNSGQKLRDGRCEEPRLTYFSLEALNKALADALCRPVLAPSEQDDSNLTK